MKPHVIDVDERSFRDAVLERSAEVPVVVDFWAEWCGPCRMLGPVLEDLAAEGDGRWILARLNVDENPQLAAAFDVRSIPHVIAFADGRPVNQFTGAQPPESVRYFLRSLVPSDEELEAGALLERARRAVTAGRMEEARADLARLPEGQDVGDLADALRTVVGWTDAAAKAGGAEAIDARAAADAGTAANRWDRGRARAVRGDWAGALEDFLEVVRSDRALEDDGARKAMVAIFALLGDAHDLTREWRTRLSRELH